MKDLSADKSKMDIETDDDAPVATTFKTQSKLRAKSEKEIRSSIKVAEKKAKERRKRKEAAKKTMPVKGSVKLLDVPVKPSNDEEDGEAEAVLDPTEGEDKPRPKKKRPHSSADGEDEFKISETFDFRKYLPENIVKEDDEVEDVDSDEEELANAIMERGFDGSSDDDGANDDDDEDADTDKTDKKAKLNEKSEEEASTAVVSKKRVRRRGGRRFRRKFSAHRVIILDRQATAEEIRKRADEFLHHRLFDSETAPRRINADAAACLAAKIRARQASIRSI